MGRVIPTTSLVWISHSMGTLADEGMKSSPAGSTRWCDLEYFLWRNDLHGEFPRRALLLKGSLFQKCPAIIADGDDALLVDDDVFSGMFVHLRRLSGSVEILKALELLWSQWTLDPLAIVVGSCLRMFIEF